MRLLHVTPELPPSVGGISDYTTILTRKLVDASDEKIKPFLVRAGWRREQEPDVEFPCVDVSGDCSATTLLNVVERFTQSPDEKMVVLLQYSGYGYARRGAPLWLQGALARLRERGLTLVTIFHELYATSRKPWESAFWMMPLQWFTAYRIAQLSHGMLTNRQSSANWLSQKVGEKPIRVCPSFSNVGEPETVPSYEERGDYAVYFGGAQSRQRVYRQHGERICNIFKKMGIEKIVNIGPKNPETTNFGIDLTMEDVGVLPAEEVSSYLRRARLGILKYPGNYLTKSGVWASYSAHGVPTLLIDGERSSDQLSEGVHFLRIGRSGSPNLDQIPSIHQNVRRWYEKNAHSRNAVNQLLLLLNALGVY